MRGLPKKLNTRADYELVRDLAAAGYFTAAETARSLAHAEGMKQATHVWVFDRELASMDEADAGDDYQVHEIVDETTGETTYRQEKRVSDPNAPTARRGIDPTEVQQAIDQVKGAQS